jgi:pimeloyl-ACP methyl ester carboxylesterase
MAAFSEERYEINGIDTAVLTAGAGDPIVFFHGGGTVTGFDAMLPLAESGRLIVPIHPGFGASVDDPTIDSLQDYHLHYLDLFERMGLGEISLAGLSLGGALAAWFAIQQPGRVRRLALAAPWGLRVPEHPTVDIFSIPDEQVLSYLFADLTPFAGMPSPPPPEFLADRYREATSLARVLWKRPYDLKLQKWLHRIAVPTLVVWGESDRLIPPAQAAVWAEHIAGAQVCMLPGTGHLVFDESPDAAPAVAEFMGAGVAA